jgi:hypothetical protein
LAIANFDAIQAPVMFPSDLFQKVEVVLLVERLEMRSVGFAALRGAFKVGNKPEDPNTEFLGCAPMRA